MSATLLLHTQNDLVLEALASARRSSFKKRASRGAWTAGFGQQLFASRCEQWLKYWNIELFQCFTDCCGIVNIFTHNPNTRLFGFLFVFFRLLHCASEELELALWLWNYNSVLVFLNEDILFLYEFIFYYQWITFLVNLQRHIPGHKVPDL